MTPIMPHLHFAIHHCLSTAVDLRRKLPCMVKRTPSADRMRRRRATGSTKMPVPSGQHPDEGEPGPVELGVIAECDSLPMADERPALAAIAKLLAHHIDDPQYQGMHPQCNRALQLAMKPLRGTNLDFSRSSA